MNATATASDRPSPVVVRATDSWVDEALAPMNGFIAALSAVPETFTDEEAGLRLFMDAMHISLPFELDVHVGEGGRVLLAGGPPTQYTETSVLPVFHQLTVQITAAGASTDG